MCFISSLEYKFFELKKLAETIALWANFRPITAPENKTFLVKNITQHISNIRKCDNRRPHIPHVLA